MLEVSRLRAGKWEGIWAGPAEPRFEVLHQGKPLAGLEIAAHGERKWLVSVPVPAGLISDGVQSFVLRANGERVGDFAIVSGAPLEADLRAEIALLRDELELLKSAFRRHCTES